MTCTKCNTWNPDDKNFCWRCQAELPKPQPKPQKKAGWGGFPMWVWIVMALIFATSIFGQCLFLPAPQ